jgi:hypothetical protein
MPVSALKALAKDASPFSSVSLPFLPAKFAAPAACILFGLLISIMPHLLWWPSLGSPVWIADNDELLYLSHAGQAYFNHPLHISDPIFVSDRPTVYPWLQLAPGIAIAKLFAFGPLAISLIWRAWAGVTIALGWYLLAKFYIRRPWLAFALSAVLLADVGLTPARPVLRQLVTTVQVILEHTDNILDRNPQIHLEWRIITPGLSLGYLLLHIWLVARAREVPDRKRILLAGTGLGILFYAYFFYWTSACVAFGIATLLDTAKKKVYLEAGCLGLALGSPALLSMLLLKRSAAPDWLIRSDFGVPIPRFSELLVPKGAILLLVLLFLWVWNRRRDLIYVWTLALSALLLSNHQILTGMQMSNFHWTYVWGPCLSFLFFLAAGDLLVDYIRPRRLVPLLVTVFLIMHLTAGLWLRAIEAKQTRQSAELTRGYGQYRGQLRSAQLLLAPNAVIAGDHQFVDLAAILNNLRPLDHYAVVVSPSVSSSEWDTRIALNSFLLGLDRQTFAGRQRADLDIWEWGLEARDPAHREERLSGRIRIYDQIAADPFPSLRRFQVKYVALRKENGVASNYIRSNWLRIQDGPYWELWTEK